MSFSQQEKDVQFLREEEKLARDVYITLYKKWKLPIFDRISQAEERHMRAMLSLVKEHNLVDPVKNDTVGHFSNKELANLYHKLVKQGSVSLEAALQVGATIEDLDIRDIRKMKENAPSASALAVFERLECGSNNHMRAFARQLTQRNSSYKAQFLSQADINAILAAPHQRCGMRGGRGRGMRRGRSMGMGGGHW